MQANGVKLVRQDAQGRFDDGGGSYHVLLLPQHHLLDLFNPTMYIQRFFKAGRRVRSRWCSGYDGTRSGRAARCGRDESRPYNVARVDGGPEAGNALFQGTRCSRGWSERHRIAARRGSFWNLPCPVFFIWLVDRYCLNVSSSIVSIVVANWHHEHIVSGDWRSIKTREMAPV